MKNKNDEHDSAVSKQAQRHSLLAQFIESEWQSCSFDPKLDTPEFVYRMWGASASLEDIKRAMAEVKRIK